MSNEIIYLALEDMVKKKIKILNIYNISGYIIYKNKYYLFQPLNNTNESITIFDRNSININSQKHINLTIKKSKNKSIYKPSPKVILSVDKIKEKIELFIETKFNASSKSFKSDVGSKFQSLQQDTEFKYKYAIDRLDLDERSD